MMNLNEIALLRIVNQQIVSSAFNSVSEITHWMENSARLDEFTPKGMNDIHGSFGDYCYPSYRHSLCHGWSSGVTAWLTENVLGIKVVEAGCRTLKVKPHLGNLDRVEGTFPTPRGVVKVKHTKLPNGEIETKVDAPEGIKII